MKCSTGAVQLIDQIIATIGLIKESDFSRPLDIYNGSTLGKHFRHIYDFFYCIAAHQDKNTVDYAMRDRDPNLECDKYCAIEKFQNLKDEMLRVDETVRISVYADFEMDSGDRPKVSSTLGREIMYAYDHAVHHLAIVKIGIKSIDPSISIHNELGVAASTIRHQHTSDHA